MARKKQKLTIEDRALMLTGSAAMCATMKNWPLFELEAKSSLTQARRDALKECDDIVCREWNAWARTKGATPSALVACILNAIRAAPDFSILSNNARDVT